MLFCEQNVFWRTISVEFHSITADRIFGYLGWFQWTWRLWNYVQNFDCSCAFLESRVSSFHQFPKKVCDAKLRTPSTYYCFSFLLAFTESQTPCASSSSTPTNVSLSVPTLSPFPSFSQRKNDLPPDCDLSPIPSLLGSWDLTSLIDLFICSLLSFPLIFNLSLNTWLLPFSL